MTTRTLKTKASAQNRTEFGPRPKYVYLCIYCYCEEFNVQLSVNWLYPYFLCVRVELIFTLRLLDRGNDVLRNIKRGI